jgi:CheY-like chemotaxis protein
MRPSAARHCRTVLVVENEPLIREDIAQLLKAEGWAVAEAATGELALEILREHPPDVVFTDVGLGGHLDGWDVGKACRSLGVPVVYASGKAKEEQLAVPDGTFFDKPYSPTLVIKALGEACAEA